MSAAHHRKVALHLSRYRALCVLFLQRCNSGLELIHAVGVLPLHAQILAAHVAVGGQLAVDGLPQAEVTDDGGGGQVKDLLHCLLDLLIGHGAGAKGIHHDGHRLCHADGVGHLHLALLGQTGSHDVLGTQRVA